MSCNVIILQSGYILGFKTLLTCNEFKTRTFGSCIHSEDPAMAIPTSGSNEFSESVSEFSERPETGSPSALNRSKSRTAIEIQSTKFQKLEKYVPELRTKFKLIPTCNTQLCTQDKQPPSIPIFRKSTKERGLEKTPKTQLLAASKS